MSPHLFILPNFPSKQLGPFQSLKVCRRSVVNFYDCFMLTVDCWPFLVKESKDVFLS
jgi:hypothetical protein